MYCSNCGKKITSSDKFCSFCGYKLKQTIDTDDSPLFKKISLSSLDLMSAEGDKWKKNTELLPDDCWILFMNVGKSEAQLFANDNNLLEKKDLVDLLEKSYFNAYSFGIWIWVAIMKNTNPSGLKQIHFKYEAVMKNANRFLEVWESSLDNIETDIPDDVKPSFSIAQVKMEDAIDNNELLNKYLSAQQIWNLKSALLGAIYRGYYLNKFFKKKAIIS